MGEFAVNDVVLVTFPFSKLKGQKLRQALVIAKAEFSDDELPITSYIRPDKLFTADRTIIVSKTGTISASKAKKVVALIRSLFD